MYDKNGFDINPNLDLVLSRLETLGYTIIPTSWGRTPREQCRIYQELYGEDIKAKDIPWGSRHLPTFKDNLLRAMDFAVRYKGELVDPKDAAELVLSVRPQDLKVGIKAYSSFVHLDVDRKRDTTW